MSAETRPFDAARYLTSEESQIAYLEEAFETGDPAFIQHCIGVLARAQGIAKLATKAKLGRTSLYKALDEKGSPEFSTVMRVLSAMNVTLTPVVRPSRHHPEVAVHHSATTATATAKIHRSVERTPSTKISRRRTPARASESV